MTIIEQKHQPRDQGEARSKGLDRSAQSFEEVTHYLNINAFIDYSQRTPEGRQPILPACLMALERSREPSIAIPPSVLRAYGQFRPTPLFRAYAYEQALSSSCVILVKDESGSPSGNHKMNSAYLIAGLCSATGAALLTTETTGNWGLALAKAAKHFGIRSISFLDSQSAEQRPLVAQAITQAGGLVRYVELTAGESALVLSADEAIRETLALDSGAYVFGSVYGYFVVPQSVVGLEARTQCEAMGYSVDFVVGSCGGGANLLGIAAPFLADRVAGGRSVQVVSAEAEECPILSEGSPGWYSVDSQHYCPAIFTRGLPGVGTAHYIGGLASTIVATAASEFCARGFVEPRVIVRSAAREAASRFFAAEGIRVALESSYQLAVTEQIATSQENRAILVNVSGGWNDGIFYGEGNEAK